MSLVEKIAAVVDLRTAEQLADMIQHDYTLFERCNDDSGFGPLCGRDKGHVQPDHVGAMLDGRLVEW